jgi:uncharacterized membrane protein YuzA (DUF378 family)
MEMLKRLEPLALVVMILGALNWGAIGVFDENVIANVFGTGTFTDVLYTIVGVAGLVYIPRVLEGLHIAGPHPRGA